MSLNAIAAQILESSAQGFARDAATHLQEQFSRSQVELAEPNAAWQHNLNERILELAAAVRLGQPALFHEKVRWLRQAYAYRGISSSVPLAIMASLRAAVSQNLPPDSAASVTQILDEAVRVLEQPDAPVVSEIDPQSIHGKLALQYIAACMEGMTDHAQQLILDAIDRGMPAQQAVTDVLMPAQREIGELWHRNDASIAQEHLLTSATADLLGIIGQKYAGQSLGDRTAVVASVSGNAHDAGIRAAAVLLRLAGWRTIFLGTDLPANEIAGAADHFGANVVILSATIATQADAIADTIAAVRETAAQPAVIVGGAMFRSAPALWESLGADALCAEIGSTVEIAERHLQRARR